MVGYRGFLTWIFRKFGVPLKGLLFPMSSNNKIGAKCLTNSHLKLSDKGILEEASIGDEEDEDSDEEKAEEKEKEKEDQKADEEDQEPVPTATHDEAEVGSKRAQEEAQEQGEQGEDLSEGEATKEEEGEELDNDDDDDDDDSSSDEEVRMPVKKKPIVTPMKSSTLASKGKRPVVSLDDEFSSHTTLKPQPTAPPLPKSATPPTHHIPSPPPSPIPSTPPPSTTTPASPLPRTSPGLGFAGFSTLDTVEVQTKFVDEEEPAA